MRDTFNGGGKMSLYKLLEADMHEMGYRITPAYGTFGSGGASAGQKPGKGLSALNLLLIES